MAGMLRVPRTRGALSGALLVLLGLWGGLIAFVGPYFHFAYTPGTAWTYTSGRLWLEILPGAATVLGGLILLASRVRPVAMFGAWIAALAGAWFAVGRVLSPLWNAHGTVALGTPIGSTVTRTLVSLTYFTGLGVIIVFLAALSIGRLTVIGVRDARLSRSARPRSARPRRTQPSPSRPPRPPAPPSTSSQPASAACSRARAGRPRWCGTARPRLTRRPSPQPRSAREASRNTPSLEAPRFHQPGGPGPRASLAGRARSHARSQAPPHWRHPRPGERRPLPRLGSSPQDMEGIPRPERE